MVEGTARCAQIIKGIRAVKWDFAGISAVIREKNKRRCFQHLGGRKRNTRWSRAIGALEINAITETYAAQGVHFGGVETCRGTGENIVAIDENGGVARIGPEWF